MIPRHPLLAIDELFIVRGDEGNLAMARIQQVLAGGGDAGLVVQPDAAIFGTRHLAVDEDHRGAARHQLAQLLVGQRLAVQDQRIALALQQRLNGVTLAYLVVIAGHDDGELVRLVHHALDAAHHLGEEGATTQIPHQHTDAVGALADQRLGKAVGTKIEFLHGRHDGLTLFWCHLRRIVDDSRHS